MGVSLADIDRWNAGAVLDVFNAAQKHANAAQSASENLAKLPAFSTWIGEAATAARESIGKTRKDLDDHGRESLSVARAARNAADQITAVKSSLAAIRADAAAVPATISDTGIVTPTAAEQKDVELARLKAYLLQQRVNQLLIAADTADQDLANVIDMASGEDPIPAAPHDGRPEIVEALSVPLPEDSKKFNELWEKLTPEEKNWLYSKDHEVGNHPGMPFVDKDYFNRKNLDDLVDQKQAAVDELNKQKPPVEFIAGRINPIYKIWKDRIDPANKDLEGVKEVQKTLNSSDGRPRYLGLLDDKGHAAISINDPDKATHNATFVPGTGQDLTRIGNSDGKSGAMLDATMSADQSLKKGDVSVTTWMGYDRPMGLTEAASTSPATDSAGALDAYQSGLRASHDGAISTNTVIGHSYGSTMVGAAASDGHHLDADRVIAVGSPGMLVDKASELDLNPGAELFASRADHDIIMYAQSTTLGPSPSNSLNFGEHQFDSDSGPAGGPGWLSWLGLASVDAHSSYFDENSTGLRNIGDIIAGSDPSHHK